MDFWRKVKKAVERYLDFLHSDSEHFSSLGFLGARGPQAGIIVRYWSSRY